MIGSETSDTRAAEPAEEQERGDADVESRVAALEDERRRLLARLADIRAELADLRTPRTWQIAPPAQWSQVRLSLEDVEAVLRSDPEAEWTFASLHQHFPDASDGQLRRQLGRLVKRGLVLVPARGRYVLARLTPKQYREAHAPHVPLRQRVLDVVLVDEARPWKLTQLRAHLDPPPPVESLRGVLAALMREHYVIRDPQGWYRVLPASARQALRQRGDTEIVGAVVATRGTTAARTRAPRRIARTQGR
ncbi:hypothetical protein [Amycolatopsis sp. cg9]|uniref:hypothetical protein n=1 Tax=Amycolatopsis sp. cg9 TaxID=3238801 RepID=UPI003526C275